MSLPFVLLWQFRDPSFARIAWDHVYRSQLELVAESGALGFDRAWLGEHHLVDDGYSPLLHMTGGAIAARATRLRIGTLRRG